MMTTRHSHTHRAAISASEIHIIPWKRGEEGVKCLAGGKGKQLNVCQNRKKESDSIKDKINQRERFHLFSQQAYFVKDKHNGWRLNPLLI